MEKNILQITILLCVASLALAGSLRPSTSLRKSVPEKADKVSIKPKPTTEVPYKIVNGIDASPGEYPHQAQLLRDGSHHCGGSLVHSCYVLTAKHCVNGQDKTRFKVRLGEHQRSISNTDMTEHSVITILEHPTVDVALLLISDSADLTKPGIGTISLATSDPSVGTSATVTGWGQTLSGVSGSLADILQEVTIPIADRAVCSASLPGTVQTHEICAGTATGVYSNACHGDSGGPLVVASGTSIELAGVVSWGNGGCPASGHYAVYVSVAQVRTWILDHIPSTTPAAGTNCHCVNPAILHDGTPVTATYDGANCRIAKARAGCQNVDEEAKSFIHGNRYYIKSSAAIQCLLGTFDTCNCYFMNMPSGGFIHDNKFYQTVPASGSCPSGTTYDGANCFIAAAPWATTAFIYDGKLYTTARKQCAQPSLFNFDGANCRSYYYPCPNPFIWDNGYYSDKCTDGNCPTGSTWDGAHCYFGKAPWATTPFLHAGRFYSTPRPQCLEGEFDGANCLMGRPPMGANAFLWGGYYYYGWN